MTQDIFEYVTQWQKETFVEATAISKIEHLKEELIELELDVTANEINKRLEFADCFILLMGAAAADGMTYQDICNAILEKMSINHKRNWGKPDSNGVVRHISQ